MNDNQMNRSSDDYANIYQSYLLRGSRKLTDAETRVLNIGTGGTVLAPTNWANFIDAAIDEDTLLSRVRRIETTTAFVQPIYTTDAVINTGVAEASIGATSADPAFLKPYVGTSGTTQYTFSLNKTTSWVKVSNELLNDTKAKYHPGLPAHAATNAPNTIKILSFFITTPKLKFINRFYV